MANHAQLIIFDGDDTLWATQPLYNTAKQQFISLLTGFPCSPSHVISLLEQIDIKRVVSLGFSRERFPESMVLTYEILAKQFNVAPSDTMIKAIRRIGYGIFEQPAPLYPDTLQVLSRLRPNFRLALLTKGDLDVQRARIEGSGTAILFDTIHIVDTKEAKEYQQIVHELDEKPERAWAVGNSIKSDINPALEIGIHCILLHRDTWHYEEDGLHNGDVQIAHSLTEAAEIITRRDL